MRLFTFTALSFVAAASIASDVHAAGHTCYEPYTYGYYGDPAGASALFGVRGKPSSATAYPAAYGPVYVDGTTPLYSSSPLWSAPPETWFNRHHGAKYAPTGYPFSPTAYSGAGDRVVPKSMD